MCLSFGVNEVMFLNYFIWVDCVFFCLFGDYVIVIGFFVIFRSWIIILFDMCLYIFDIYFIVV